MKYANPKAEHKAVELLSFIRQHFGTQTAFAEHMGVRHQHVSLWVKWGWMVVRDDHSRKYRLCSPKRFIPTGGGQYD